MKDIDKLENLSREDLIAMCKIYAKNWLAHDGSWFLAIEEKYGMDQAIEMDREAWRRFTIVEAMRLIEFLELGDNSGLAGLEKALRFRMYGNLNRDRIEITDERTLMYYVETCRVQEARERKGLDYFPCKSVGIVEYGLFATAIDRRFTTECLSCHPDVTLPGYNCVWKFTLG